MIAGITAPRSSLSKPPTLQLPTAHDPSPLGKKPLELSAKHLKYSPGENKLDLSGNVVLKGQSISFSCDNLSIILDINGLAQRVEGWSKLRWSLDDNQGRADRIHYLVQSQMIELIGNAQLSWKRPQIKVKGRRIQIDLKTGRFMVHQAHADFSLRSAHGS